MKTHRLMLGVLVAAGFSTTAHAADHLLSGTIASTAGEKLAGVTVSAKAQGTSQGTSQGATITTSVYTDDQGNYYFPALPAGKYSVWAQALAFELTKGEVDLTAAKRTASSSGSSAASFARGASIASRAPTCGRPATSGRSATSAPAAIRRATCCSSASTRTAGTRSSI